MLAEDVLEEHLTKLLPEQIENMPITVQYHKDTSCGMVVVPNHSA